MNIGKNANNHEVLFVERVVVVSELARLLHPEVPYVWILGHMPYDFVQWQQANVPLNSRHNITARVRAVTYDIQMPTQDFLAQAADFDEEGLSLIQSHKLMPDSLYLFNIPESRQDAVIIQNGGFLRMYLPHALESASVVCYQPGYLMQVAANIV